MERTTRLRLAAAPLLGLLLPPGLARAQGLAFPSGVPSGGFVLQNPTSVALAARDRSTGVGFARGALPSGSGLTATVGGAGAAVQLDVHSLWPDGSARWATVTVPGPALAAGAASPVALAVTGSPAAATTLAWANPALTISLLGGTLDLGAALRGSTDLWMSGPLAVQRRADLPVPGDGATHVVADVTCYADGTVVADVQVRRDVGTAVGNGGAAQAAALAPLSYTATVVLNGATTTQAVSNQNQYQDLHWVLGDDGVNVQHDVAGLEAAGLVPPYDLALGVSTAGGSVYAGEMTAMAASGFGAPLGLAGLVGEMETTGGRPEIGITTGAAALCLRTQDDAACRFMRAQADAGAGVPWHFWDAQAGRWMDAVDHPNLWAAGKDGQYVDYLAQAIPSFDTANTPSHQPWDIATSHAGNLDYVPALLTGSRFYRDMQQAQATAALLICWPPQRGIQQSPAVGDQLFGNTNGDGSTGGLEVRSIAWSYRETVEAWALASPGSTASTHLAKVLADSWAWWNSSAAAPAWTAAQGSIGTFVPGRYTSAIMPPWEQDYLELAVGMGALLGDPGAVAAEPTVASSRENGAVPQTGYDPANSIEADWQYLNGTAAVTTWAGLQASQKAQGWPRTPTQLDGFGDYDSLLRASLAMHLRLVPGDATARAGLAGLLGAVTAATSNIGAATYQGASTGGGLVQEALALPAGITGDASWATQETALASGGSGSSTPAGGGTSGGTSTGGTGGTGTGGTAGGGSTTGGTTNTITGTVSAVSGVTLPYPGEALMVPVGGLHLATANGVATAAAAGAIPITATTLPASCRPGDTYYVRGARLGTQAAGAGLDAPGYCNAAGQVVLIATGLPPTF